MKKVDLIIYNIGQLITLKGPKRARVKEEMKDLGIINKGAIAINNGKIEDIGEEKYILDKYSSDNKINAKENLVTPGFVDPHTHPVFAGTREEEFEMRIKGLSYKEIAKRGGGIRNSARKFQKTPKEIIKKITKKNLDRFLVLGTTTIEAKSGYGLNTEAEIKSLEILKELDETHPIDIVPTFLGAHEIPDEYQNNREEYIRIIIEEMLPQVAERKLAKYCDIFCEEHVFNIEESRRILQSAKKLGFELKLHADELTPLGGAELAAELKAVSADHLVAISDNGIKKMKEAGVIAVLLPCTTFYLGSTKYAPARKMIEEGVPIALSTDFNPGSSMTQSMCMVLTIGALYLKMLPDELITAVTINSAYAINKGNEVGSLEIGKKADILIWKIKNYKYLPYHFGDNLIKYVIKNGKILVEHKDYEF